MFQKNFKGSEKLNVIVRRLQDCEQKKSKNGYFLVSENWGTCFFREAEKEMVDSMLSITLKIVKKHWTDKYGLKKFLLASANILNSEANEII